jgi:hypothetical protein
MNSDFQIDLQTLQILLEARGITLEPKPDGKLKINAQTTLEPELLEAIKTHKSKLLEKLPKPQNPPQPSPDATAWLELQKNLDGIYTELVVRGFPLVRARWFADSLEVLAQPRRIKTRQELEQLIHQAAQQAPSPDHASLLTRADNGQDIVLAGISKQTWAVLIASHRQQRMQA